MIFQCAKCKTQLDLSAVPRDGRRMAVKCTQCGHIEENVEFAPDGPRSTDELFSAGWRVRKVDGEVLTVGGLPMLRDWIAQGELLPEDEISDDGENWKPVSTFLGDAALGLHHPAPLGRKPPPLPTEMGFPRQDIPHSTLDAPDPEEEFSEVSSPLDQRETTNYTPVDRPVSEPLPAALPIQGPSGSKDETALKPPAFEPEAVTTSDRTFPVSFAPPRRVLENDTIPHETLKAIEDEASEGLSDLAVADADSQSFETTPAADDALREAVDYLTTSESRALRFTDTPPESAGDVQSMRPPSRQRTSLGPLIAAVVATALLVGLGSWLFQSDKKTTVNMANVQQPKRISPADALSITRLLSEADRFIAEDSDTARDKADRLYAKVLERIGTEAKAPALSAAAHLGLARIALIRAEYAQLSGRNASTDLAAAAASIGRAKVALKPQHTLWLEADLARLQGNVPAVLAAVNSARQRNQVDAFWTFVEATASLHTSNRQGVLEALDTVRKTVSEIPRVQFIRAHLLARHGRLDEAKAMLTDRADSMIDHAAFRSLKAQVGGASTGIQSERSGKSAPVKKVGRVPKKRGGQKSDIAKQSLAKTEVVKPQLTKLKANATQKGGQTGSQSKTKVRARFKQLMSSGSSLLERGRVSAAKKKFEEAAKLKPKAPEPHANLGWCAIESKSYTRAVRLFKKSLIVQPRFSDGLFGLGYAYEKKGQSRDAAAAYRRYLQHYPQGKESRMVRHRLQQLK